MKNSILPTRLVWAALAGVVLGTGVLFWCFQAAPPRPSKAGSLVSTQVLTEHGQSNPAVSRDRTSSDAVRPSLPRIDQILAELASGRDGSTGLEFKVGPNGGLASAPTRRVALLDELTRLDPKAAAARATNILSSFGSSDEWAVAMRAYALANRSPEDRAYLTDRFRAMIGHDPWLTDPTVGFLEGFDVAVHLGGTNLMPALTDLVRLTNNQAVAHAAYLALDRLTINDPVATLTKLQAVPTSMHGREVTRANYFARADVADPRQLAIVENYLLNPNLDSAELNAFVGLFPLASFHVEPGLLSPIATPDHSALIRRDRGSLAVIKQWLLDPRFKHLEPQLQIALRRLEDYARRAAKD